MKVFLVEEPHGVVFREIPLRVLKPDEVLVKVVCAGICGTDLSIYTGETDFVRQGLIRYPVRIGHEWSGVVAKIGSAVSLFCIGDRVVGDNGVSCGICEACRRGDYENCVDLKSVGTINCWDGCFADYIILPQRHLFHLPDSVSYEQAALIEPSTISLAALKRSNVAGKTVAVIGTGPIGLSALALAKSFGAANTVMIGRTPSKLDVAFRLGATHVIRSTEEDAAACVSDITQGRGADVVLEASGALSSICQTVDIVAKRGSIYLLAFYEKELSGLKIDKFIQKEVTMAGIMGQFGLPDDIIRLMSMQELDLLPMVTSSVRFDELPQTFAYASQMKDRIKILVHF
jgi:L-iditol 2-dehydrogenase